MEMAFMRRWEADLQDQTLKTQWLEAFDAAKVRVEEA